MRWPGHALRTVVVALGPAGRPLCVQERLSERRGSAHQAGRVAAAKPRALESRVLRDVVAQDQLRNRAVTCQQDRAAATSQDAVGGGDEDRGEAELADAFHLSRAVALERDELVAHALLGVHERQLVSGARARRARPTAGETAAPTSRGGVPSAATGRNTERAVHVDQPGVDPTALTVDRDGVFGRGDLRADRFDQPVAQDDRRAFEFLSGRGDDRGSGDGVDPRPLRRERGQGQQQPAHPDAPASAPSGHGAETG